MATAPIFVCLGLFLESHISQVHTVFSLVTFIKNIVDFLLRVQVRIGFGAHLDGNGGIVRIFLVIPHCQNCTIAFYCTVIVATVHIELLH